MSADPEDVADDSVNVKVPYLEPDYSVSPFATGPDIVPPTQPVNLAPFIRKEPEPILGPEHAPFHPPKVSKEPDEPTHYVEIPPIVAPADRWGIPQTERVPRYIPGSAWDAFVQGLKGTLAGLVLGVLGAAAVVFLMVWWHFDTVALVIAVGLLVGWIVPIGWRNWGTRPGLMAALISLLAALAVVVASYIWVVTSGDPEDFALSWRGIARDPQEFIARYADEHLEVVFYVALASLAGFIQAARPRKLR